MIHIKTGAVILAAGSSQQMKEFRPLMCIGGQPMICRIVDMLMQLKAGPIAAVLGERHEAVRRCLSGSQVVFIHNRRYAKTDMLESLKLGLKAIQPLCDRAVIIPADLPLVKPETVETLLSRVGDAVVPEFAGLSGHPIVLSGAAFDRVLAYEGENGLRGMMESGLLNAVTVPVDDRAVLMDVNTREDYGQASDYEAAMSGSGRLHLRCDFVLAVNKVVVDSQLVLLLQMLEYTGSLQSASECVDMSYSRSWRLIKSLEKELGTSLIESSAGGVKGGGSKLTEAGRCLVTQYQKVAAEGERVIKLLFRECFSDEIIKKIQKSD